MAWTIPEPRASGDKITDSIWNLQLIDNLQFLYDRYPWYICIQDQKAAGTPGGDFTLGAWRTRDLNTEVADTGGFAAVAANQITLASGIYRCRISCPSYAVNHNKAKLYDITNAADLLYGTSMFTSGSEMVRSDVIGSFTLTGTTVLEVQHRSAATQLVNGFGIATNIGVTEIYTVAEFWRINNA